MRFPYATLLKSALCVMALNGQCGAVDAPNSAEVSTVPKTAPTAPISIAPNYFMLKDALGSVNIVWDKHLPLPSITYTASGTSKTFTGDEIIIEQSQVGQLLTVTTSFKPDIEYTTLSIMIPDMRLANPSASLSFNSFAIITRHRTPFIRTRATGVINTYQLPVNLRGTAKAVP